MRYHQVPPDLRGHELGGIMFLQIGYGVIPVISFNSIQEALGHGMIAKSLDALTPQAPTVHAG